MILGSLEICVINIWCIRYVFKIIWFNIVWNKIWFSCFYLMFDFLSESSCEIFCMVIDKMWIIRFIWFVYEVVYGC